MAFTDYTSIDDVIRKYRVRWQSGQVVTPDPTAPLFSATFQNELQINLNHLPRVRSEIGGGEVMLFPLLREVWKEYRQVLRLFTHEALEYDSDLCGYPDYFICPLSGFGLFHPQPPSLIVVEARLDNFQKAWGRCLAAMIAAQSLHAVHASDNLSDTPDHPVYGITSTGRVWEFGVLRGLDFTQQQEPFSVGNLDSLRQALHAVFRACRDMALAQASPASTTP